MPTISSRPRFRRTSLFPSMLMVLIVVALGWAAYAQTQDSQVEDAARGRIVFSRLLRHPASLGFRLLNYNQKNPPTTFQSKALHHRQQWR